MIRPADPIFSAYLELRDARMRLRAAERVLLDEWVREAEEEALEPGTDDDATGDSSDTMTHTVAFEGHPASLLDEPPSRPVS